MEKAKYHLSVLKVLLGLMRKEATEGGRSKSWLAFVLSIKFWKQKGQIHFKLFVNGGLINGGVGQYNKQRVDSELLQKSKEKGLCNSASNHPKEMISQMMKPYKLHKSNKNCLLGNWRVRELEVNFASEEMQGKSVLCMCDFCPGHVT